jgi:hypothetical protein
LPHTLSIVAAIYSAGVRLYPPDFRREFASEMTRDFRQATNEAWCGGAWTGVLALWAHLGADFVRTLVLQWVRSEWPAIALIPAACSLAGFGVAARLLPQTPRTFPTAPADRDLLALMLLILGVLMIVVATIIFTLWFTRPLHRRRL